eukprot:364344-Chlamydomonas_euryale.AAC.23
MSGHAQRRRAQRLRFAVGHGGVPLFRACLLPQSAAPSPFPPVTAVAATAHSRGGVRRSRCSTAGRLPAGWQANRSTWGATGLALPARAVVDPGRRIYV